MLTLFQNKASAVLISKKIWDNSLPDDTKGTLTPSESDYHTHRGIGGYQRWKVIEGVNRIYDPREEEDGDHVHRRESSIEAHRTVDRSIYKGGHCSMLYELISFADPLLSY